MPRVQAVVVRDDRVLMVKHRHRAEDYWCLPGGALEPGETLEEGALRELREECNVDGVVVKKTALALDVYAGETHSFLVDIGDQQPSLGHDPEVAVGSQAPILVDARWLSLSEMPERDRAFVWSAGLLGVGGFAAQVEGWGSEISYPGGAQGEAAPARPGSSPQAREDSPAGGPRDILSLLDELRAIAQNGLHFASDPYDRERYERLMTLATQSYGRLLEAPPETVRARLSEELGIITPKVGSNAAIFNQRGEILLMKRVDNGRWCLPCGWVEPNERPRETAVREAREETGLEVAVQALVGVFTRMPSTRSGPHTLVAVVHLCDVIGGELRLSHEGTDLRYWPIEDVEAWSGTHERYARAAQAMWKSGKRLPAVSD